MNTNFFARVRCSVRSPQRISASYNAWLTQLLGNNSTAAGQEWAAAMRESAVV